MTTRLSGSNGSSFAGSRQGESAAGTTLAVAGTGDRVPAEDSPAQLELLTRHAETALERLGIPYRRKLLAAGDTGFSSAMTYDLEAWAPGVGAWLEVSSCSNFVDYQARRANIRYRPGKGEKPRFVHTLNGSGLAFPRTLACILEHYQQTDGSVLVPDALRPYFGADRLG